MVTIDSFSELLRLVRLDDVPQLCRVSRDWARFCQSQPGRTIIRERFRDVVAEVLEKNSRLNTLSDIMFEELFNYGFQDRGYVGFEPLFDREVVEEFERELSQLVNPSPDVVAEVRRYSEMVKAPVDARHLLSERQLRNFEIEFLMSRPTLLRVVRDHFRRLSSADDDNYC